MRCLYMSTIVVVATLLVTYTWAWEQQSNPVGEEKMLTNPDGTTISVDEALFNCEICQTAFEDLIHDVSEIFGHCRNYHDHSQRGHHKNTKSEDEHDSVHCDDQGNANLHHVEKIVNGVCVKLASEYHLVKDKDGNIELDLADDNGVGIKTKSKLPADPNAEQGQHIYEKCSEMLHIQHGADSISRELHSACEAEQQPGHRASQAAERHCANSCGALVEMMNNGEGGELPQHAQSHESVHIAEAVKKLQRGKSGVSGAQVLEDHDDVAELDEELRKKLAEQFGGEENIPEEFKNDPSALEAAREALLHPEEVHGGDNEIPSPDAEELQRRQQQQGRDDL